MRSSKKKDRMQRSYWVINKPRLDFFLIIVISLIHIDPPIFLLGSYVSSLPLFLLVLMFFLSQKEKITNRDVGIASVLIVYLIVNNIFTPSPAEVAEKLKGSLQLFIGVVAFLLFHKLNLFKKVGSESSVFLLLLCLIVGVFSELYFSSFQQLSDEFRAAVFPTDYLYQSDERDYALSGVVRPKVFSSEPSHVAKTFFILSAMLISISRKQIATAIICLSLSGVMYAIYQSPIILGTLILVSIKLIDRIFKKREVLLISVISVLMMPFILNILDINQLGDRFEYFGQNNLMTSENIRLYFPFITAIDVLVNYPLIGVGPSNISGLENISRLGLEYKYLIGNNSLAKLVIFFGATGVLLFGCFLWYHLRSFDFSTGLYLCAFVVLYCFMTGGLETAKFWISLGLVFGCENYRISRDRPNT